MRKFLLASVIMSLFALPLIVPVQSHAQTARDAVCAGLGSVSGTEDCSQPDGEGTVDSTLKTVINVLSIIGGVIAVIMIIIGGIRFMTSSGDSSSTAGARNTIIYAIIGLMIIALAQIIVLFVLERAAPTAEPAPETINCQQGQPC